MAWVKVKTDRELSRMLAANRTVSEGTRAVAEHVTGTMRQLTYGRAVETGRLAASWETVRTPDGYRCRSTVPQALYIEGGTGTVADTPRGRMRIVTPRRGRVLRFPAPTSWNVPTGTIMYRRWVKGVTPQHIARDAGRAAAALPGVTWRESQSPINRATDTVGY